MNANLISARTELDVDNGLRLWQLLECDEDDLELSLEESAADGDCDELFWS